MEGYLAKTGEEYILYSKDNNVLGITSGTIEGRKLSKQNCEDIERGYDLDELAEKHFGSFGLGLERVMCYKAGFKKALELLGDKMYTESHMAYMMAKTCEFVENHLDRISSVEFFNNTIKSLQPKEWDVEIIMSEVVTDDIVGMAGIPKLDDDGCLILKRI